MENANIKIIPHHAPFINMMEIPQTRIAMSNACRHLRKPSEKYGTIFAFTLGNKIQGFFILHIFILNSTGLI